MANIEENKVEILLFYFLLLETNDHDKINNSKKLEKRIAADLGLILEEEETVLQIIRFKINSLLKKENIKLSIPFYFNQIEQNNKSLANKKIIFVIEKQQKGYFITEIMDDVNKHFNYKEILPLPYLI